MNDKIGDMDYNQFKKRWRFFLLRLFLRLNEANYL